MPGDSAVSEGGEDKAAAAAAAGAAEGEEQAEKAEAAEGEAEASTPLPTEGAASSGKKITNQFNFSERASQTYNNPYRVGGTLVDRVTRFTCANCSTVAPLVTDHSSKRPPLFCDHNFCSEASPFHIFL